MAQGPQPAEIALTSAERTALERYARRPKTAQALALRARIVLACADRPTASHGALAAELHTTRQTVGKWRARFATQRLEGLLDEPRVGAPGTITDAQIDEVVRQTLETTPPDGPHWSTRGMAARVGLSQTAVSRIWRAVALQPHRAETFTLSTDPQFVEQVRDIVGLDLDPPDRALVLAVDEKTQIPARAPTAPVVPMHPGQLERHTHDYVRHGTTDLFAALDVRAGTVIGETHRRHRSTEFRHFLDAIDQHTPAALDVHLILDNSSIHKTPLIQRWLAKRPRFHVHVTPTSASWLNLVEGWFSVLQRRELTRGVHRSTSALEQTLRRYIAETNAHAKPFVWTKTADQILDTVRRYCQRTFHSDH
ncbi:MAG: IS630 family transposase [Gemmatimonadaceae bacterium]|nr:IS630 family transposase [Gemmatimonadaceae bacterium]